MKKLLSILTTLMLGVVPTFAEADVPTPMKADIGCGSAMVYDFGDVKLHAYSTGDALADVCYLLESKDALVMLESPAFKDNLTAWNGYIEKLGKPVVGALLAYHPTGEDKREGIAVYATENAVKNWGEGGGIRALTDNFVGIFGEEFDNAMPKAPALIREGESVELGGILFNILAAGDDAYGVEIPAIRSVYRHMMGSKCHNILANLAHIDAIIAELEGYQRANCALVLTSHWAPEGQDAVAEKIAYLKKAKELAASAASAETFTQAMNEAFPGYEGANYLQMTAGMLLP